MKIEKSKIPDGLKNVVLFIRIVAITLIVVGYSKLSAVADTLAFNIALGMSVIVMTVLALAIIDFAVEVLCLDRIKDKKIIIRWVTAVTVLIIFMAVIAGTLWHLGTPYCTRNPNDSERCTCEEYAYGICVKAHNRTMDEKQLSDQIDREYRCKKEELVATIYAPNLFMTCHPASRRYSPSYYDLTDPALLEEMYEGWKYLFGNYSTAIEATEWRVINQTSNSRATSIEIFEHDDFEKNSKRKYQYLVNCCFYAGDEDASLFNKYCKTEDAVINGYKCVEYG